MNYYSSNTRVNSINQRLITDHQALIILVLDEYVKIDKIVLSPSGITSQCYTPRGVLKSIGQMIKYDEENNDYYIGIVTDENFYE